jgi:hypothetical protein
MKIISAVSEEIARLHCSCCDEDHIMRIKKNKFYDPKEENDALFYFEFDEPPALPYPILKERIRRIREFLKSEDYDICLLLNMDQLIQLYSVLLDSYPDFVASLQPELKFNPERKPEEGPWLTKRKYWFGYKRTYDHKDDGWYEARFALGPSMHMGKLDYDSLSFKIDAFQGEHLDPTHMYYHDFELGYLLPEGYPDKEERRRSAKEFLLKKSRTYFLHYEVGVTVKMLIDMLRLFGYIAGHKNKDEHGEYIQCTS